MPVGEPMNFDVKYFESHVTIEPVFDERLEVFKQICARHGFRAADLLMQKRKADTATRSSKDTFCTGRHKDYAVLMERMNAVASEATGAGFQVWRKKIEAVVFDERFSAGSSNETA